MNNFPLRLVLLLCASLLAGAARADCGTERWAVKTGTDATVQKIHEDPTPATINQLSLISAPINPMIRPTETAMASGDMRKAFLRMRANSIEGGTSEVMRNIIGERVLGLAGEPRNDKDVAWKDVPRS